MPSNRQQVAILGGLLGAGALALVLVDSFYFKSTPPLAAPARGVTTRGVAPETGPGKEEGPPRLAVLIYFDQMRGDYLVRWDGLFEDGGFKRLDGEGAWFQNCHYPYAGTWTAAGHASVATGCSPWRHGIIGNEWYDAVRLAEVSCVVGPREHQLVPAPLDKDEDRAGSPELLLAPTLADALKVATGGKGKVVALSIKNRAAVLPGGMGPDACYWIDRHGRAVTSTYYRPAPHAWASAFNKERVADRWFGKTWEKSRSDVDYVRQAGPDDVAGEGTTRLGRTFPHLLVGKKGKGPGPTYQKALTFSPFGNELVLDLARRAIDAEKLGQRDVPDLLTLSFSSNDLIGHVWGPDSQEVLDVTLRSDRLVKQLLAHLDRRVGKGRYVVVLTADHGVCPLPEVARARGHEAGRIDPKLLVQQSEAALDTAFPIKARVGAREPWVKASEGVGLYLNRSLIGRLRLRQDEVEQALAGFLVKQRGVQAAYTHTQLLAGVAEDDAIGQQVQRSFHADRSPDVVAIEKPYYFRSTYLTGTTHGTPHFYDTHVPLLVYGPGVRKGVRKERVAPQAAAPILARALGITPPARAEVGVPAGLFQ